MQIHPLGVLWRRLTFMGRAASSERTIAIIVCTFCGPIVLAHGCYMTREFRREGKKTTGAQASRLFSIDSKATWSSFKFKQKLSKDRTSKTARTSSEIGTSRFCNHFSIIPSYYACKMFSNCPEMPLVSAVCR